ncbi:MAG: large-conductance mechanosensitive channel protein MscL [Alphaproteobacteria bacterium]|nr:large-conductance mechanosensitive channel protein MscL [Alphaproteobacteria bacterium]
MWRICCICRARQVGETSLLKEFRDFAMRGNVVDLAVGLILGTAFGAIIKSLVDDIITPPIGLVLGNVDFSDLRYVLQPASISPDGTEIAEVALRYGAFLNFILTFAIVAFAMFMIVRVMNNLRKKEEAAPAPPEPTQQEKLLIEIRDLLARQP